MPSKIIVRHPDISKALQAALGSVGATILDLSNRSGANVNFVFTDDTEVCAFNKRYRKKNESTNVLSFPFSPEDDEIVSSLPVNELGDVIISIDTAQKEAAEMHLSSLQRLTWLMTHGFLHLIGYDHEQSDSEATKMARKEEELLTAIDHYRRPAMPHLAINVDHVATIREARGITEPDPVTAAGICELAGAKGIVVHLREDRRHIQDRDVRILRETVQTKLNLEMGATKEIISIALAIKP